MAKKSTAEIKNSPTPEIEILEVKTEAVIQKNPEVKKFLVIVFAIVAILGLFGSFYFFSKYQALKTNPDLEAQKETKMLISALGELMELPTGEVPTIATISDKEKLKDQPFFKTAENGDKLFAYNTAMIAILYRPSSNKIINVAPISIDQK